VRALASCALREVIRTKRIYLNGQGPLPRLAAHNVVVFQGHPLLEECLIVGAIGHLLQCTSRGLVRLRFFPIGNTGSKGLRGGRFPSIISGTKAMPCFPK